MCINNKEIVCLHQLQYKCKNKKTPPSKKCSLWGRRHTCCWIPLTLRSLLILSIQWHCRCCRVTPSSTGAVPALAPAWASKQWVGISGRQLMVMLKSTSEGWPEGKAGETAVMNTYGSMPHQLNPQHKSHTDEVWGSKAHFYSMSETWSTAVILLSHPVPWIWPVLSC